MHPLNFATILHLINYSRKEINIYNCKIKQIRSVSFLFMLALYEGKMNVFDSATIKYSMYSVK
jgi:hypothetical protein